MATTTPNLGLLKPVVGASADEWGGDLNASLDTLDAKVLDKTTGGTVSGNLSVTGTVNTPNVNAATALNLQTGGSTKATLDTAGNLGLGVTPSVWSNQYKAFETSSGSLSGQSGAVLRLMQNAYVNAASNFTYVSTAAASQYVQAGGAHSWHTVGSGTAATQFSFTQAMTLTSGGNLLVGTTSDGSARIAAVRNVNDGGNLSLICNFTNGVDQNLAIQNTIGGAADPRVLLNNQNNGAVAFGTNNTERARITSGGNLLVGTTVDNFGSIAEFTAASATTVQQSIFNTTASATAAAQINLLTGANSASISYSQNDGLKFSVATRGTERARITSAGDLLVGTTSQIGVGARVSVLSGGNALHVQSSNANATNIISYNTATSPTFSVANNGQISSTSTTITSISDQRVKENIRPLSDGLAAINALQPRMFDWKEGKGRNVKNDRGFIAQEFATVFPDMIEEWKDGDETYKALRADLIPILVKAVQELSAKVAALEAK